MAFERVKKRTTVFFGSNDCLWKSQIRREPFQLPLSAMALERVKLFSWYSQWKSLRESWKTFTFSNNGPGKSKVKELVQLPPARLCGRRHRGVREREKSLAGQARWLFFFLFFIKKAIINGRFLVLIFLFFPKQPHRLVDFIAEIVR